MAEVVIIKKKTELDINLFIYLFTQTICQIIRVSCLRK